MAACGSARWPATVRRPDGRFEAPPWKLPPGEQVLGMMLRDEQGGHWLDTRTGLGVRSMAVPDRAAVRRDRAWPVQPNWTGAYEDREGGIWLASTNAGCGTCCRAGGSSRCCRALGDPGSLRNAFVLGTSPSAMAASGRWAAMARWILRSEDRQDRAAPHLGQRHALADLGEDQRGQVWIGSSTLVRYDPKLGVSCVAGGVMPVPMHHGGSSNR
jgi:hypothetical protein